jgi:PAS domain S-box-containing protein
MTIADRQEARFREHLDLVHRRRDRVFAYLMAAQWLFGVGIALIYSPYGWEGRAQSTHIHVYSAIFLGGALSGPTILLTLLRPGWVVTRHVVTVSQMLWSALLIHLTGGRIETHFHVFGSLAFLAFYRDWTLLITATVMVSADHLIRGLLFPESVYGIVNPEWWRFLEHAFWVAFENIVLVMGIVENHREMRALAARQIEQESTHEMIEQQVVLRTRELHASREQYRSLVETTRSVPWQFDLRTGCFTYVGPQAPELLGCPMSEWLSPQFWETRVHPSDRDEVASKFGAWRAEEDLDVEYRLRKQDGSFVWIRSIVGARSSADEPLLQGFMFDVTERRRMELELAQAQKLESVGRLASGIAHEINTPMQFVSDNLSFVRDAFGTIIPLLDKYKSCAAADRRSELDEAERDADLDYLMENVPKALECSVEGLGRVTTLVRSMKEFAHPDQKEMAPADLNRALSTTLVIARNEYKYVADVETDFEALPPVDCRIDELNQTFLNIIVNASHAIADVVSGTRNRGKIRMHTRRDGDQVVISISDSGNGIPESIRDKIFDPFFTTKSVGRGTGQGLSIARNVVVEKHGGTLTFESEIGRGTTFVIRLPIAGAQQERRREAA